MFKGLGSMMTALRNAREFGAQMQSATEKLKGQRTTASTGAGMVEAEVNGLGEVVRIKIDPELVARGEREMIEDLIPAAVNQAVAKARELQLQAFSSSAAGMDLSALAASVGQMSDEAEEAGPRS